MQRQSELVRPLSVPRMSSMTYPEFLKWSRSNAKHAEWVDGEVFVMPAVSVEHTWVANFLIAILTEYVKARKLGVVLSDPNQMKLPSQRRGRQPDVFFVKRENLKRVKELYCNGPADLVMEVISQGSRRTDRVEKFQEYERAGIPEYWIIDPKYKQVEIYRLDKSGEYCDVEIRPDGICHSMVVKGFWIKINWLWERPTIAQVLEYWKKGPTHT